VNVDVLSFVPSARINPGNSYGRGRLNTVDLLVKIACFVKIKIIQ
jgi:hypothetical protein